MNVTRRLSEEVAEVCFDDFDDNLIEIAHRAVLDGVSNVVAGSREPLAEPLLRYYERFTGEPCTVVGRELTLRPQDAAYVNATFCHSMDFELMWYPPTHPTSPTLPVVLALAQVQPVTGRQALEALVAGFEVTGRINLAIFRSVERWLRGFHPPGVVGPFGATATAGKLLGLDPAQMEMAFGIAGSRVCGIMANTGTMTKSSHSANAARAGIEAAMLAAEGYTSQVDIFGARWGFNEAYFDGEIDLDLMVDGFGNPYRMVEPGLIVKKFPSQYPTHWSIDAALELVRNKDFTAPEIESVVVEVGADNESAEVDDPPTGLAGKFTIRYTVAAALLDGEVVIDTFRDERHAALDMRDMIERITVVKREDVVAMDFAVAWSRVTVRTKDGREYSARVDRPLGIWDNPIDREWQLRKYDDCVRRVYEADKAAAILRQLDGFGALDDVGSFVGTLAAPAGIRA